MTLSSRLAAIEKRIAACPAPNTAVDAETFRKAVLRLADGFHDADGRMPDAERQRRYSPAQNLAWALRFGTPEQFDKALADAAEMVA